MTEAHLWSSPELLRSISWRYRPWGTCALKVYQCFGAHVRLTDDVTFLQLARYLNRTYWEKKQEEARKSPTPSAPAPVPLAEPVPAISQPVESHVPVQPVNIVEVWWNVQEADGWRFRPRLSLCSCPALSAAVSEWRIWGEPRAVSQSFAECRHHFS